MNLVDKQNSRNNLCFTFFSPLCNFFIDLLTNLLGNLPSCPWKQRQKALWAWVNHIYFMESNSVDNLLSFLDFPFWTADESRLGAHSIIVWGSCKTSSSFWYFSGSFINCDDIAGDNFLFLDRFDHLLPQIIHCFHLGCFESDFTSFGARCWWLFYLYFHHFSLHDLWFFFNSNSYWSSEGLCQGLSFTHFQWKNLWSS